MHGVKKNTKLGSSELRHCSSTPECIWMRPAVGLAPQVRRPRPGRAPWSAGGFKIFTNVSEPRVCQAPGVTTLLHVRQQRRRCGTLKAEHGPGGVAMPCTGLFVDETVSR